MKTRYLAKNFEVSAIGYGAMGLSEFYGAADDAQSLRVLHKLIELDQTFIDTAAILIRRIDKGLVQLDKFV